MSTTEIMTEKATPRQSSETMRAAAFQGAEEIALETRGCGERL
jgi:hypothetical protein